MATTFVPTSNRRIPGAVVKDFITALGLDPDQVTQLWMGYHGITAQLRVPLEQAQVNTLLGEHPGMTIHGDSTHIEGTIGFAIDWEDS